jgi:hypothetical protein
MQRLSHGSVWAEIRSENVLDTSLERYRYTNLLKKKKKKKKNKNKKKRNNNNNKKKKKKKKKKNESLGRNTSPYIIRFSPSSPQKAQRTTLVLLTSYHSYPITPLKISPVFRQAEQRRTVACGVDNSDYRFLVVPLATFLSTQFLIACALLRSFHTHFPYICYMRLA